MVKIDIPGVPPGLEAAWLNASLSPRALTRAHHIAEKAAQAAMTTSSTPPLPPRDEHVVALHAAAVTIFAPAAAVALRLARVVCTRLLLAAALWVGAGSVWSILVRRPRRVDSSQP